MDVIGNGRSAAQLRQANIPQGTGVAALVKLCAGRVAAIHVPQQLVKQIKRSLPERPVKSHSGSAAGLAIEKASFWNLTAQHLFQTEGLSAELHLIRFLCLIGALFVLYRIG